MKARSKGLIKIKELTLSVAEYDAACFEFLKIPHRISFDFENKFRMQDIGLWWKRLICHGDRTVGP
eukprot:574845-Hanusia_phi.AAC.1